MFFFFFFGFFFIIMFYFYDFFQYFFIILKKITIFFISKIFVHKFGFRRRSRKRIFMRLGFFFILNQQISIVENFLVLSNIRFKKRKEVSKVTHSQSKEARSILKLLSIFVKCSQFFHLTKFV